MPVVAIVNQKGGVGKTTLATNLAWVTGRKGQRPASSMPIPRAAPVTGDTSTPVDPSNFPSWAPAKNRWWTRYGRLSNRYDWLIIDGPPGISNISADAVRVADVVLIPAKASAFDVWAATDIVAAVKARQQDSNGTPKAAFVITMAKPRTRLGRQIDAALAELGLPVLQSRTTDRVAYTQAGNDGTSVIEGPDRTARDEVMAIRDELEQLNNDH